MVAGGALITGRATRLRSPDRPRQGGAYHAWRQREGRVDGAMIVGGVLVAGLFAVIVVRLDRYDRHS